MSFGQRNKKNDSGRAVDNYGVAVESDGATASEKESNLNATYQKWGTRYKVGENTFEDRHPKSEKARSVATTKKVFDVVLKLKYYKVT